MLCLYFSNLKLHDNLYPFTDYVFIGLRVGVKYRPQKLLDILRWKLMKYVKSSNQKLHTIFDCVKPCLKNQHGHDSGVRMFSGFQEILLLVLIGLGVFLLPRMIKQTSRSEKAAHHQRMQPHFSGKMRLALVISVLWPLAIAFFIEPWEHNLNLFLLLGPGIVCVGWSAVWVISGFKR